MTLDTSIPTRILLRVSPAVFFTLFAHSAMAQTIQGTATFRERMALPPAAVFEATLEDVSRADAPSETIARTRLTSPGNPPIAFTITYDPAKILPDRRYVVRARILLDDKQMFTTDTATSVITHGSPTNVSLMLRRAAAGESAPPSAAGATPLEGTHWTAIELAGKPVPKPEENRDAHLVFQAGGRVSGSDGCNRVMGSYELKGDAVKFGQMAGTQMACMNTGESERAFRDALKGAARLTITGDRLELFDATGKKVAAFTPRAQAS
jgi:putative lipoprotein